MERIKGKIVAGYGVASGRCKDARYPNGTIALQQAFFMEKGIDLSGYFSGTLNIDLAPFVPAPGQALFDGLLRWTDKLEERFVLTPIQMEVAGHAYSGLWYYPHPDTKIEHFQAESVVELLLPWIDGLQAGEPVVVGF